MDYRIHSSNTVGLENIVDEKALLKKRVNSRISFLNEQEEISNYLISKKLDKDEICKRYRNYLENRKKYMYKKSLALNEASIKIIIRFRGVFWLFLLFAKTL